MKTGIILNAAPDEIGKAAAHIKEIGYDCADLQMLLNPQSEYYDLSERELLSVKAALQAAGIEPYQAHGPWLFPPKNETEDDRKKWLACTKSAVRACAVLGCTHMVMHPIMPDGYLKCHSSDTVEQINREFFASLLETAAEERVHIALENMPFRSELLATPEEISAFVGSFESPWFEVCLDTGHSLIRGVEPAEAVRIIGKEKLGVLHVHDNNGGSDRHDFPYKGKIDWNAFRTALREIGFEGVVSLEPHIEWAKMPAAVRLSLERALFTAAHSLAE